MTKVEYAKNLEKRLGERFKILPNADNSVLLNYQGKGEKFSFSFSCRFFTTFDDIEKDLKREEDALSFWIAQFQSQITENLLINAIEAL